MKMKPSELIADRKRWTTGMYAADEKKRSVHVDSPEACAWCAVGAIHRCCSNYEEVILAACDKAYELYEEPFMSMLNDGPDGHRRVLRVLRAIGQ